jgi:hypothetical protein
MNRSDQKDEMFILDAGFDSLRHNPFAGTVQRHSYLLADVAATSVGITEISTLDGWLLER